MISQHHVFSRLPDYDVSHRLSTADTGTSFQQVYVTVAEMDRLLCEKLDQQLQAGGISKHKRKREIAKLWITRQKYLLAESDLNKSAINAYYGFNYTSEVIAST